MKVQASLNDDLVKKIDAYAEQNYMTRSGMISFACSQYLLRKELAYSIKEMSFSIKKIAETCSIDDNIMMKLMEFERLSKSLLE